MDSFIKELDIIIKRDYTEKFFAIIKDDAINSTTLNIFNDDIKKLFKDYNLGEHISIKLGVPDCQVSYYYKGCKMEPICYWLRPDNYREVSIIEMLLECIKQDTHRPDIKHLEVSIIQTNEIINTKQYKDSDVELHHKDDTNDTSISTCI